MSYRQLDKNWIDSKAGVFLAVRAVTQALCATRAHSRSPAFALHRILRLHKNMQGIGAVAIVRELVGMPETQVATAVVWNSESGRWVADIDKDMGLEAEISVSGDEILTEITEWYLSGLDFERSPRGNLVYPEDEIDFGMGTVPSIDWIGASLMPLDGEKSVRSEWCDGERRRIRYTFSVWHSGDVNSEDSFMWEMKDETRNSVLNDTREPMTYARVEGIYAKQNLSRIGVEPEFIKIPLKVGK